MSVSLAVHDTITINTHPLEGASHWSVCLNCIFADLNLHDSVSKKYMYSPLAGTPETPYFAVIDFVNYIRLYSYT